MSGSPRPEPGRRESSYRFGPGEFDEARMELRVGGRVVKLQRRPLDLLRLLLRSAGRLLSKEDALRALWGGRALDADSDATLANAVSKLRQALGPALAPRVVTVARLGFRFDGGVDCSATGASPESVPVLDAGCPVPGRDDVELVRPLGQAQGRPVWLGVRRQTGEARVYKFALTGERLSGLQREYTLHRYLRRMLGERGDLVRVLDRQFREPPFWLECESAGTGLDTWAADPAGDATRLAASPRAERIAMFLAVADALAAVHAVQVLHGDVKPSNILVAGSPAGWRLRLADFGSARLLEPGRLAALDITALGMTSTSREDGVQGTPHYLAPELLAGQAPGIASDVYALGVVLCQWLAGDFRRPMATGWPRDIGDELLVDDIARATDRDPARRFGSVAELAQRLRELPRREAERAERARQAERRAALQAEAERAFDRFVREDLIAAANPAASGRADITVAEAVEAAAGRIDARFAGHPPEVRAGLHASMQSALSELSRTTAAIAAGQRAVNAWREAPAVDPGALADVRLRLAVDLVQLSHLDAARAVAAALEHDAPPALRGQPDVHRGMAALLGEASSYAVTMQTNLALALHRDGDPGRAEALLRDALRHVAAFADDDAPQAQQIRYALAECLVDLARPDVAAPLLDGLDAASLNLAQQEPDWPARLARLRARSTPARPAAHQAGDERRP